MGIKEGNIQASRCIGYINLHLLRGQLTILGLSCKQQYCLNYAITEDKVVKTPVCLRSYLHVLLVLGHKADIIPWLFKMRMTDIAKKSSKLQSYCPPSHSRASLNGMKWFSASLLFAWQYTNTCRHV